MLTNEAWEFVAKMWDDFGADGAPSSRQVIDSIWPDLEEAAVQLLFTAHYARLCRENEQMCQAMSEFDDWFYGTYSPSRMPDILVGLARRPAESGRTPGRCAGSRKRKRVRT